MSATQRGTDAYFWWEQGANDEAKERKIRHPDLKQLAAVIDVLDEASDRWPDPMGLIRNVFFPAEDDS